ncbi:MAG: AAA family ATPase [Chloroflexota bacterium]|nr:AAA family ATPase [Chloroflexota bacterium]
MSRLVDALTEASAYPHPVDTVQVEQTHISWVFLAGDFAYKIKKPVNFGFLDYSTLEKRRFYCEEEVRLNRRLAPDVYIGVVPVTQQGGDTRMDGEGEVVEYAVKMRRLSAARMLDRLLEAGRVQASDIRRLAEVIAGFHASADRGPRVAEFGSPSVIRANWLENFEQVQPFVGSSIEQGQLDACHSFVQRSLERQAGVFEARLRAGRIRDCHGDLRSESIWMADDGRFEIFDCIEFNERFRYGDVASEVAFLASDFDWRGRPDLAWLWTERYIGASADEGLRAVSAFYKCYRAFVRGKVESFAYRERDFHPREARGHLAAARQHFALAALYAVPLAPVLLLTCGEVGSGKTSLARALGSLLGLPVLSSDVVRKELAGLHAGEHRPAEPDSGLYTPDMSRKTYAELRRRSEEQLRAGKGAVVDASFSRKDERAALIELAREVDVPYVVLGVTAPPQLIRERILGRGADADNPSDADLKIYELKRSSFEPPTEVPAGHFWREDTSRPLGEVALATAQAIGRSFDVEKALPSHLRVV